MIYANDNDETACEWMRHLPLGINRIDSRSITEIEGSDLEEFIQCHFFAGIGGWPYALQLAGWPSDVPAWTGSCPCQPFSAAGKRRGTADERHLWPEFLRLIAECRPPTVFGEQVASKAGREWLAGVRADLEALGYAVGAADLCAASVGAPHIRQRLFWVAYASGKGFSRRAIEPAWQERSAAQRSSESGRLGHSECERPLPGPFSGVHRCEEVSGPRNGKPERSGAFGWVGNAASDDERRPPVTAGDREGGAAGGPGGDGFGLEHTESNGRQQGRSEPERRIASVRRGEGFWGEADYLYCSDGKYRPVEPGAFPLAHGIPGRVAQLRGLGNAIVPQVAAEFVIAFMETLTEGQA